jgi:transcriptional regulator with GAF, ATPase, and Fis domain
MVPSVVNTIDGQRTQDHQKAEIEAVLKETRGRIAGPDGAAARLGIPASTLESRIRALKINKHAFRGGI